MKRRGLLGALLAIPVLALPKMAERDHTALLQRAVDLGYPIVGGSYRITSPLHIRPGNRIEGNRITCEHKGCLFVADGRDVRIFGNRIEKRLT